MPTIKLFNGEEFAGDILEDRDSDLVLGERSCPIRVIPKREIASIDF